LGREKEFFVMVSTPADGIRILISNRKARHLYHVERVWETGIVLCGPEVKSLRQGGGSMGDAYGEVIEGEVWLHNLHIPPYDFGNRANVDTKRKRKLLLLKTEIRKIYGLAGEKGHTLVPLSVYFTGKRVKVELALVRGKKDYDKRQDIKERESRREMDRAIKDSKR
jgi:SsrA-binding protein